MNKKAKKILEELYISALSSNSLKKNIRNSKREITCLAQESLDHWSPFTDNSRLDDAPFQIIDFFSGSGGMTLGFAAISKIFPIFNILGGCDLDEKAAKTFQINFNVPSVVEDVRTLDEDESKLSKFMGELYRYDKDKPLIVIGCPPCQGFTSHRKKNWHREDSRNSLVGIFASIAVKLDPVCVIMENVPDMLAKRYWNNFKEASDILAEAGYHIHQTIYNAASFGVPQERFRALMIAMKRDFLPLEPILNPEQFSTVRDAIGDLPVVPPGVACHEDKLHRSANHRRSTLETIQAVPKNGGSRPRGVGPKCLDRISGFYDVYGRLFWDKPAITITHYARNPASGRFVHPVQDRGLTIREAALIQSFPRGFEFFGTFDSMFKQIGEAVPPRFSCAVATNTLIELLAPPPNKDEKENALEAITVPISDSYSSVIAGLKLKRNSK